VHNLTEKRDTRNRNREIITALRSLTPGTSIVIDIDGRDEVVFLVESKTTHIICEYPDGRRYSVPAEAYDGVNEGSIPARLSPEEREQRESIRYLGRSKSFGGELVARGLGLIPALLDELSAAQSRVAGERVGPSEGFLDIGMVRKLRTRDRALVTRIPGVVAQIAKNYGAEDVLRLVEAHPDTRVRSVCGSAIRELLDPPQRVRQRRLSRKARMQAVVAPNEGMPGYGITLTGIGPNKISVIKELRELTAMSLFEAFALVSTPPRVVIGGLSQAEAEQARGRLTGAGAAVEIFYRTAAGEQSAVLPEEIPAGSGHPPD
jgi:ribosomal protein L7/L12